MTDKNLTIILASKSSVRAQILRSCQIPFMTVASQVDEAKEHKKMQMSSGNSGDLTSPALDETLASTQERCMQGAKNLAEAKAHDVAKKYPNQYVLGADQTGWCNKKVLTKARNRDEAYQNMRDMEGKWHHLYSHVALVKDDKVVWSYGEKAQLKLRMMSEAFLQYYLDREKDAILACLAGYRFEGLGQHLFESYSGDYYTILGLPAIPLLRTLRSLDMTLS